MVNKKSETCTESVLQAPLQASSFPKKTLNFYTDPKRVFFPENTEENPVTSESLIAAYLDYTNVYELIAKMFIFVRKDQRRVLSIVEKFYNEDPSKHRLLIDLVDHAVKKKRKDVLASILWMRRTADLICKSLMEVYEGYTQGKQPKINEVLSAVYKRDMYPHHGRVNKQLHTTALFYFVPSNEDFFKNLNYGVTPVVAMDLLTDAEKYCRPMAKTVTFLHNLYRQKEINEDELGEV